MRKMLTLSVRNWQPLCMWWIYWITHINPHEHGRWLYVNEKDIDISTEVGELRSWSSGSVSFPQFTWWGSDIDHLGDLVQVSFEGSVSSLIGGACPSSHVFRWLLVTGGSFANMGHDINQHRALGSLAWVKPPSRETGPGVILHCSRASWQHGLRICVVGS